MAILGAFAFNTTASLLHEMSVRQLNALAESKKRDLSKVQEGWRDQLKLIKSRTQLREDLKAYVDHPTQGDISSVSRIIEDAVSAVDDVDKIRILDLQGNELVSYGTAPSVGKVEIPSDPTSVVYDDTLIDSAGRPVVVFSSLLSLDGKPVGVIEGTFNTRKIESITANYTGLGKTGEVLVVMKYDKSVQLLNPVRHESGDILARIPLSKASAAARQALAARPPAQEWLTSVDYRGVKVWAATRYLPELRWGIVVKV
ncbi:MAG TPA: cache domain-containing protein, partial [Pseudomonadales bacterium]|nr:cache domain-containing protein [Pseudomonadales bacterium]